MPGTPREERKVKMFLANKKTLLAVGLTAVLSGWASAQSSVTVFGVVDLGVRHIKNESSGAMTALSQDGISSSRLGIRGSESLGGDWRAGFWLEGQLSPDTGLQQGWARRSTVSLAGPFGEIRLGRDFVPDFWNFSIFDPFGTNGVGQSLNVIGAMNGAATFVRASNSIGYHLPPMAGLYGQVMVAAGEGTVGNKHIGGRLGYSTGPLDVAVAYGKTDVDEVRDWKRWNVGLSYNFGFMTFMALFTDTKATGGVENGSAWNSWLVGGVVPFGASTFKFSYNKTDGRNRIPNRDSTQYAIGYQYNLSSRTALYANAAQINNDSGANSGVALSAPPGNGLGSTSKGVEFGVSHVF